MNTTLLTTHTSKAPDLAACAKGDESTVQRPVPSTVLLQGHKAVNISHNGMLYTLQATKLGKLILTK